VFPIADPRFTLAIKFAASKEEALSKLINLDTEPILEYQETAGIAEHKVAQQHLNDIKSGKLSKAEIEKIIRLYENKLKEK